MKVIRLYLLLSTLIILTDLLAQDTIYLKNGFQINAKIIEIGIKDIRYQKTEIQDGPIFVELKSNIWRIVLKSGDQFELGSAGQAADSKIQTSRVRIFQKIDIDRNGFYQNGKRLSYNGLYRIFKNTQMDSLKKQGYLAINSEISAKSIRITAIPILSIGIGIALISVLAENVGRHTFAFDTKLVAVVGLSTIGVGGGLLLTGFLLEKRAKKKLVSAIDLYNQKIK